MVCTSRAAGCNGFGRLVADWGSGGSSYLVLQASRIFQHGACSDQASANPGGYGTSRQASSLDLAFFTTASAGCRRFLLSRFLLVAYTARVGGTCVMCAVPSLRATNPALVRRLYIRRVPLIMRLLLAARAAADVHRGKGALGGSSRLRSAITRCGELVVMTCLNRPIETGSQPTCAGNLAHCPRSTIRSDGHNRSSLNY